MMRLLIFALMVAMVSIVTTPDAVAREKKVKVPCQKEGRSTKEEIRAYATGSSLNVEAARQKALASARTTLSANIEVLVKTVNENYMSSYELGVDEDYRSSFNQVGRNVVNRALNFAILICDEVLQDTKTKQYKVHVALSLAGKELSKIYEDALGADQRLRTDFERSKFLEIFKEEMEAYAKRQQN